MRVEEADAIEHATLAAVPPERQERIAGWLVPLDSGTVGRAHSAAPLSDARIEAATLRQIEDCYRAHGLKPMFRVAQRPEHEALRALLTQRGYAARKPTLVQVADSARVARADGRHVVALMSEADATWCNVYLGEGFDAVDGASRVQILQRGRRTVFACVQVDGVVAAVGTGCYSHGLCGIHGLRTLPTHRGRGYATSIIAALAREAQARGVARAFLQVEQANPAQALYRRIGFGDAWAYEYWSEAKAA